MKKFEYKIVDSTDVPSAGVFKGRQREDLEAYLCALGQEGWEIVNVDFNELEGRSKFFGVAKRELA